MGGRFALLIASTTFDHLRPLESPAHDVKELEKLLSNPAVGRYSVITCVNEPYDKTREWIEDFFKDRGPDDHLLLYVSTHGLKDDRGHLYFASRNTSPLKLHSTTFESSLILRLSHACLARQQVFILDSCFSGAFGRAVDGRSKGVQRLERQDVLGVSRAQAGSGVVVMAGSNSFQLSYENQEGDNPGPSVFTRHIVEGIATGGADADGDGRITADELFNYAQQATRRHHPGQTPQKWVLGAVGDIDIAQAAGGRLPRAILTRVRSRHWEQRLLAVTILEGLCKGDSPGQAQAARLQLQRFANQDDSERVRLTAQAAIGRVTVQPPIVPPLPVPVNPVPPPLVGEPVPVPPLVEPVPASPVVKPEKRVDWRRFLAFVPLHITDLPHSLRYVSMALATIIIGLTAWMLLRVQVPDVVGMKFDEATKVIAGQGLTIKSTRRVEDAHRAAGTISEQQPKPGESVFRSAGVALTVAMVSTVVVPGLAGMTYTEARQATTTAGLTTRRQTREVPEPGMVGKVVEQFPIAGRTVDKGSEVLLTIGAATRYEVPNVVGRALAEAQQILTSRELQAGAVSATETRDAKPGSVVQQMPAAGATVQHGQRVDLVIARAPLASSETTQEQQLELLIRHAKENFDNSAKYGLPNDQYEGAETWLHFNKCRDRPKIFQFHPPQRHWRCRFPYPRIESLQNAKQIIDPFVKELLRILPSGWKIGPSGSFNSTEITDGQVKMQVAIPAKPKSGVFEVEFYVWGITR